MITLITFIIVVQSFEGVVVHYTMHKFFLNQLQKKNNFNSMKII